MEHMLQLNSLHSFDMIRKAALEYSGAEFKFYQQGFIKYTMFKESNTLFIDDIYILPHFRGTPLSSDMLGMFTDFMKENDIIIYIGRVFKNSNDYKSRMEKFRKWGMTESLENEYYTLVSKHV